MKKVCSGRIARPRPSLPDFGTERPPVATITASASRVAAPSRWIDQRRPIGASPVTSVFVHTEVRERCLPDGPVFAGVFPAVPVGDYTLLATGDRDVCNVTISEGGVTEVHW